MNLFLGSGLAAGVAGVVACALGAGRAPAQDEPAPGPPARTRPFRGPTGNPPLRQMMRRPRLCVWPLSDLGGNHLLGEGSTLVTHNSG
jgi:hypothetical protein